MGAVAAVADAEEVGVMLAWEECDIVALDSQGVIQRIQSLQHQPPRSWVEEKHRAQMGKEDISSLHFSYFFRTPN